jgi:hypothetical protein
MVGRVKNEKMGGSVEYDGVVWMWMKGVTVDRRQS